MFFLIGIVLSVFMSLLLFLKRSKSRADKILAVWLLFMAVNQLFNYLLFTEDLFKHPDWLGVDFAMPLMHGIFLYFYVLEITGNKLKKRWTILLHLIPALILIIVTIPFYQLSGEEKTYVFQNDAEGFEWNNILITVFVILSGLAYSIWSLILIKRHKIKIQNRFSNTDKKELQWLRLLSIFELFFLILETGSSVKTFSGFIVE